jgi:hypothetical protein
MASASLLVVLCEDERQQRFVRRYLKRLGFLPHEIRARDLPSGAGSGEQWVREHYAEEVGAYRARSTRARTVLVVAIDADANEVTERQSQLHQTLTQRGLAARSNSEAIAHLIPKRNIETWILCLNGNNVDEVTDYRGTPGIDALISTAASKFFEWTRDNANVSEHCVQSLVTAIPEARRCNKRAH